MDEILDIPIQGQPAPVKNNPPAKQPSQTVDTSTIQPLENNQPQQPAPMTLPPEYGQPETPIKNLNQTKVTNNNQAEPQEKFQMPDINQIEQNLQQSGQLLNEINIQPDHQKIDTTPLSSLQPDNMLNTQSGPQPMNLPSEHEKPLDQVELTSTGNKENSAVIDPNLIKRKAIHWIKNLVAIALTIQGLRGIYKSIIFIIIEYPKLETQLLAHQITKAEVNSYATHSVIILITTIIGMIFALKIMRNKAAKIINILIGIGLFFGSAYLDTYLTTHFDLASLVTSPIFTLLNGFFKVYNQLIDSIPFVEKNATGGLEIVWYQ